MFHHMRSLEKQALETADFYASAARREKAWILRCQSPDGLILHRQWEMEYPQEEQTVIPYFSTIAALGLMAGTPDAAQAQAVLDYQHWYLSHLNTAEDDPLNGSGTICDYRVIREGEQLRYESTGSCDSVDSYAALFLLLADSYGEKVNSSVLLQHNDAVLSIIDALLRTLDEQGLSRAMAEYPVQYLMDNAEVYAGLMAAQRILRRTDPQNPRLQQLHTAAEKLRQAAETLFWDETRGRYIVALSNGLALKDSDWDSFYPGSISQLFPACFGLLDMRSPRSADLYQRFCLSWDWETLEPQQMGESRFFWCAAAYAAAQQGDAQRLSTYLAHYQRKTTLSRNYPLYTGEAGWLSMACVEMQKQILSKIWWKPWLPAEL